ncbi:MAG: twin-arginine translocase TatA/TatE family subunit [Gordonia sp. (in: high G+C Gram-positive bacteria)]|uniref:twin-arginine translocase TatA/TatE family subunit n=1 Tax=Gordonia sp. (in: high G+C Gram-positive bacteria) TaxID=84139 RepID=UPI0039E44181
MPHELTGWHALVALAAVLLIFGSTRRAELADGVGRVLRALKDEVDTSATDLPSTVVTHDDDTVRPVYDENEPESERSAAERIAA